MKKALYVVFPMITLLLAILVLLTIESIFTVQIMEIFNIEKVESFNTFNNGFIIVTGLVSLYLLKKHIMEINEIIFRIFTFALNFLGIITIMTVFIRLALIK